MAENDPEQFRWLHHNLVVKQRLSLWRHKDALTMIPNVVKLTEDIRGDVWRRLKTDEQWKQYLGELAEKRNQALDHSQWLWAISASVVPVVGALGLGAAIAEHIRKHFASQTIVGLGAIVLAAVIAYLVRSYMLLSRAATALDDAHKLLCEKYEEWERENFKQTAEKSAKRQKAADAQSLRDAMRPENRKHGAVREDGKLKWDKYMVHGPAWGRITGGWVGIDEELTAPPEADQQSPSDTTTEPTPGDDRTGVRIDDKSNGTPAGDNDAEGAQTPDPPKKEERKP